MDSPPQDNSSKILLEVGNMEKIESIRKGNIWLNVFKTDDGQILMTVNKSYRDKNGKWEQTAFLNPRRGDIYDLMDAIEEFRQFEKAANPEGATISPSISSKVWPTGFFTPLGRGKKEPIRGSAQEVKQMRQTVSEAVSKWLEEENQSRVGRVVAIRKNSPWYGMSDEEIEDRREFIRCYLLRDFEPILMIPAQPVENDFWFASHEDFIESPFNTWDFQKMRRPFDKYGYRVKKVLEQVKDLALLHSCISQPEGRKNMQDRFEMVVNEEFRNPLLELVERYRKTFDEERRFELRCKIARLSRYLLECKAIWQRYSPWEEKPSSQTSKRNLC